MAVDNDQVLDALFFDKKRNAIVLRIDDNLPFIDSVSESGVTEEDHLYLLQDKLNAYIDFLDTEECYDQFPDVEVIDYALIDIYFDFEISETCERFLNAVKEQIEEFGILVEWHCE